MWRRLLCTSRAHNTRVETNRNDSVKELKKHVHRLYKHIHPDRLGRYPTERSINESSFKVLQSALERHFSRITGSAQTVGAIPPQAPQRPQELVFYIQGKEQTLQKAVVKFHESRLGTSLHSLFESLSLEPPPKYLLPGNVHGDQYVQFSSLTELMGHARKVAMHTTGKRHAASAQAAAESMSDIDREILVTRLALQRSRGITITLGKGLPSDEKLVGIFRRLANAIKQVRDVDLSTLIIELNGGFDVELNIDGKVGFLSLGACAARERWQLMFQSQQLYQICKYGREYMDKVREKEALAAHALGIRLIMHDITLVEQETNLKKSDENECNLQKLLTRSEAMEDYTIVLDEIINKWRQNTKTTFVNNVETLVVMITTNETTSQEEMNADIERGLIRIKLSAKADGILKRLDEDGEEIAALHIEQVKKIEMENELVSRIRSGLQLDGLRRGEGIDDNQYMECLQKLGMNGAKLRAIFDGASIVIGTQARLLTDSNEVEIPFDFDVRLKI